MDPRILDPAAVSTLITLLQPGSNGISFLTNPAYQPFSQSIVDVLSHQYYSKALASSQELLLPEPQGISQLQWQLMHKLNVHFVTIQARDILTLGPTNPPLLRAIVFEKLCQTFSVPDYYGYTFESLDFFLRDLSWLSQNSCGHILVLSIAATGYQDPASLAAEKCLPALEFLWQMLRPVAGHWQNAQKTFHTVVVAGNPLQLSRGATPLSRL